jgi:Secretion system C-terminal sorting domain
MANSEYVYFRLLMGANNHHAKYSPVRKVSSLHTPNSFQLAGNPVKDEIKITATATKKENLDIQVINQAGQVLVTRQAALIAGNNLVKVPVQHLAPGMYFVKLSNGNSAPQTFRVLKQ